MIYNVYISIPRMWSTSLVTFCDQVLEDEPKALVQRRLKVTNETFGVQEEGDLKPRKSMKLWIGWDNK